MKQWPKYRAHVIVYEDPTALWEWMPIESTTHPCTTAQKALASLLSDLEDGMAKIFESDFTYESDTLIEGERACPHGVVVVRQDANAMM